MGRKKATDEYIKHLDRMDPSGANGKRAKAELDAMSDAEFARFAERVKNREEYLVLITPVGMRPALSKENMMKVGEDIGIKWKERCWTIDNDGNAVLKPQPSLILMGPTRRQSQRQDKKASIPLTNSVVDTLTHQPTGPSKGSAFSMNQLHVLSGQGLDNSIVEFAKLRGGDQKAFDAYNKMMYQKGSVALSDVMPYEGGVRSKQNLATYFTCMHYDNTM